MSSEFSSASVWRSRVCSQRRDAYLRRFQLLRYNEVMRLCDVMETEVPIHGTGNFPTLKIRPSRLVQILREKLSSIGVKVHDIRLNGSAATHVLSDDPIPTYKDLDLIFAIDFPDNVVFEEKRSVSAGLCKSYRSRITKPQESHKLDSACNDRSREKYGSDDYLSVDDSGYTSSGSSIVSDHPPSGSNDPLNLKSKRIDLSRSGSVESLSSTSSMTSRLPSMDAHFVPYSHSHPYHQNWQEIKEAVMEILVEFLPEDVSRIKMNSLVLASAYVRKMVKVTKDSDRWSLISLNNNLGRNLELKFVQHMKRQFEFSVDSFQILLDTYLDYRHAAQVDNYVEMSEVFHPTVVAESVYGDFAAALRHLRHHRICTHRPEEIRGGGLLRYCNLLARDFIPGDCDEITGATLSNPDEIARLEKHMCARFFIDFSDIEQQRLKLIGYLDSHFQGEDELKFQYLLVLRRVVDCSTFCLMLHERTMILDLITILIRETLAHNVAGRSPGLAQNLCNQGYMRTSSGYQCDSYLRNIPTSYSQVSTLANTSQPLCYSSTPSSPISSPSPNPYSPHVEANFVNYPIASEVFQKPPCCWSCCCWNNCRSTSYSFNAGRYSHSSSGLMQPVYYSSNNITCYYNPATHNLATKL